MTVNISIDDIARAAYISFRAGDVAETRLINDMVLADLDEQGAVIGLEVVGLATDIPYGDLYRLGVPEEHVEALRSFRPSMFSLAMASGGSYTPALSYDANAPARHAAADISRR